VQRFRFVFAKKKTSERAGQSTGALPEHRGGVPSTGAHVSALGPCLGFLWLSLKKNMAGALRHACFKNGLICLPKYLHLKIVKKE